jgi:hypothetical protein
VYRLAIDVCDRYHLREDAMLSVGGLIYVNGDNNLESFRRSDQTWRVRLIEEEF